MKPNLLFCIALALLISCNDDKAAQETTTAETKQQAEAASTTETSQPSGDDIVGNWKLTLEAYDDNSNKVLDEAERKKGVRNNYSFRFNADGSCQIQQVFKGHYEVKTEGDKKVLYVYLNRVVGEEEKDPPPDIYRIISMGKTELVLLEQEGNLTFWVFEKVG
jgi:hypothetical protein